MAAGVLRWSRRGRARTAVVAGVVVIGVCAALAQVWPAFATATPDPDIAHYALFAMTQIELKGGNGGTSVIGGNIGVKYGSANHDFVSLGMCRGGSGHPMKVLDEYQVVADTIDTTDKCDFYDMFTNQVTGTAPNVRHTQDTWTPPLNLTIPTPPAFACSGGPQVVAKNATVTLPPGTYGFADWQDGSDVTLQSGVYFFCNLDIAKNVTVHTASGVDIRILEKFTVDNGSTFGTACDAKVFASGNGIVNGNTINFGQNATVWGTISTATGEVALGRSTDLHGRFWGFGMHDDFDMQVHLCDLPQVTTTTSSSTSTSTSTSTTTTTAPSTTTSTATTVPVFSTTTVPEPTTIVTEATTATSAPTTTTVPSSISTLVATTTTIGAARLPRTGSDRLPPLLGLASLAIGGALTVLTRRRNLRRL